MTFVYKHGDRPLAGYTIQRGVGRGGFGEVYYAISDAGKEVALKYLRDNPQIELRGVEHCMNLKHPNLVNVYDIIQNDVGEYFVVMEYISGPSLRDLLISEPKGLGPQKAAFILSEIGKGLGYLHEHGIVHRDLKPGNIFYEDGYVKIGDYGLSKFISISQHSAQTSSVGTVHYMAPEVGSGNYGQGVDIYALGVILYEMLLGRVPYEGSSMGEVLMKHLTAQPAVDELPAPFGAVIRKALAKDPKDRFATVDEMVASVMGVEDIRNSVARFEPTSVSMAAARVAPQYANVGVGGSSRIGGFGNTPEPMRGSSQANVPYDRERRMPAPPIRPDRMGQVKPWAIGEFRSAAGELSPESSAGVYRYAGFWIRFVASFIDTILVAVLASTAQSRGGFITWAIVTVLYESLLLAYWRGQTIGKKICRIRVISVDGTYCSLGQAFVRSLSSYLSLIALGLGYIWVAIDPRKRAWHDHIAGTLHVYAAE